MTACVIRIFNIYVEPDIIVVRWKFWPAFAFIRIAGFTYMLAWTQTCFNNDWCI